MNRPSWVRIPPDPPNKNEDYYMSTIEEKIQKELDKMNVSLSKGIDATIFAPVIEFNINGVLNVEVSQDAKTLGINLEEMFGKTIFKKMSEAIQNAPKASF